MKVFHRTVAREVAALLQEGFQDVIYVDDDPAWRGVWLQNLPIPLDEDEDGALLIDDVFLTLDIPEEPFAEYEQAEEGMPYRNDIIPAARLTAHGRPHLVPHDEACEDSSTPASTPRRALAAVSGSLRRTKLTRRRGAICTFRATTSCRLCAPTAIDSLR